MSDSLIDLLLEIGKALIVLVGIVGAGAFMSFIERRLLALWQDRYGPNRVGPFGLLQLAADMIKMFFKEDWIPPFADRRIFVLAPSSPLPPSFWRLRWCRSPHLGRGGPQRGAALHPGHRGAGGLRRAVRRLVEQQQVLIARQPARLGSDPLLRGVPGPVANGHRHPDRQLQPAGYRGSPGRTVERDPQILGFITFLFAGVAVTHRHPFDQPEAEQELADGYHIEYAGMKWGLFFVGEYIGIVLISSLIVTLFFGGWHGPGCRPSSGLP